MTRAEQDRVLRDGFRAHLGFEQALIAYAYFAVIVVVGAVVGGWRLAAFGVVVVAICMGVIAAIWRRQLSRAIATAYPAGSTAISELDGDRLRLVDAVATVEIGLASLRKPRVSGSVVSVIKPGARWRRTILPRALLPDEVVEAIPTR